MTTLAFAGLGRTDEIRKEIVIILLRASIAVFTLGIGSAYAADGDGYSATTLFTSIQHERAAPDGSVAAQVPTVADQNVGAAVQTSDARSQGHGSWLLRVFSLP
jgi:hypothetical protein